METTILHDQVSSTGVAGSSGFLVASPRIPRSTASIFQQCHPSRSAPPRQGPAVPDPWPRGGRADRLRTLAKHALCKHAYTLVRDASTLVQASCLCAHAHHTRTIPGLSQKRHKHTHTHVRTVPACGATPRLPCTWARGTTCTGAHKMQSPPSSLYSDYSEAAAGALRQRTIPRTRHRVGVRGAGPLRVRPKDGDWERARCASATITSVARRLCSRRSRLDR